MPLAFQGFSIREYAAKMRSVDVLKCCPFVDDNRRGDVSKEQAEALLPPITVTKFRLWSHELERIKSHRQQQQQQQQQQEEEESTMVTLTNKESNEEIPTNDAVQFTSVVPESLHEQEEEEDEMEIKAVHASTKKQRQSSTKRNSVVKAAAKFKAPKKRSIAEIFAEAPQIQTVDNSNHEDDDDDDEEEEEDDEEDDDDDDDDIDRRNSTRLNKGNKVKRRKKELVQLEYNNEIIDDNNKKKKLIKENPCKLKRQSPVNFAKKLHRKFAKDNFDAVTARARTPNLKYLSTQKKKVPQTSKFIPKQKKPMPPARSILKNRVLCGQNSRQGDSQANTCGVPHSRRHVRFSGKVDILGPSKKGLSVYQDSTAGNIFSDTLASSSEKDQSADSDKEAAPVEVQRSEHDISISTDNGSEACSKIDRNEYPKLLDHVDLPSFLRPHISHQEKAKHFSEKTVPASQVAATQDNNLHMFNQGYLATGREPAYAGIASLISALRESCGNTQGVTVSRTFDSSGGMINHPLHPIHEVSMMSSKENAGSFVEPSMYNFILSEKAKGRVQFLSQSERERVSDHGLYSQSICPPMDLMGGSYPFPQWRPRTLTFTERLLNDNFQGLPLNSHGELIQLSSGGGSGFNQLGKLNAIVGPSSSSPAYNQHFVDRELPSDRLNLFPMQNYLSENHNLHLPDRFGAPYLESTQTADIQQPDFERRSSHSFRPLGSDLNLVNISRNRSRQFDQVRNQNTGEMFPYETSGPVLQNMNQPTMRLMGKDVPIGKSSRENHGFEDGKVWMDKEIITEHCPSNALQNSSLNSNFQQNWFPHTTSAKLKGTVSQSFEIGCKQPPQSSSRMKAPVFRFPHPYEHWPSRSGFEHGSLTASRSPSSNILHFSQSPTSPAMLSGAHNFRQPFISRTESLQSQLFGSQLPVLSNQQSTYKNGNLRPAELNHKQNLSHFGNSTFDFPFLNPECRESVQPSWFQNSSKAGLPPWLLHATLLPNPPIIAPQTFPNTTSRHLQDIMHGKNSFNTPSMHHSSEISHSQMRSSSRPASAALPQHFPAIAEESPSSAMVNMSSRKRINVKERMKPNFFGIRDPPFKKTKRLAADSTKLPNIIDFKMQEKSSVVAGWSPTIDFIEDLQSNFKELDLESSQKQASGSGHSLNKKDGSETFNSDGAGKSGPIKLCAGAKHILKPTQNVDQDKSRPIRSTIPFVAVTNDCAVPEPQKRATKLYKL